jgi:hypothetical protein
MSCYVSSNDNRFYVALEQSFGEAAAVTAANRIPAVQLAIRERKSAPQRRDKTGTRTFAGFPIAVRTEVEYELTTYMSSWQNQAAEPACGPLFRACLGSAAKLHGGGTVAAATPEGRIVFGAAHGLEPGDAVAFGGEIRFVMAVVNELTVQLNAPFTFLPSQGSTLGSTATYRPGSHLASVSLFDYWSPAEMVQRALAGCGIDRLEIEVNGDYHGFKFSGLARELMDSASFASGQGSLTQFPPEPLEEDFDRTLVPGHLGQAWLGTQVKQCFTLTEAKVTVENGLNVRSKEFGTDKPSCLAPGERTVRVSFSLYCKEDPDTIALYQAARQGSPISVMFQLGQESGQLFGMYLKSVVPEPPSFNDQDVRLQWKFGPSRAQGTDNDEIQLAFA